MSIARKTRDHFLLPRIQAAPNRSRPSDDMRWPVAKPAHVSHEIVHAAVLMLTDEIPNRVIEIK